MNFNIFFSGEFMYIAKNEKYIIQLSAIVSRLIIEGIQNVVVFILKNTDDKC